MVVIEMRDAAYETAFELINEAKHDVKKTKLTLCELENAIYDCYEASKEMKEDGDHEESTMGLRTGRRYNYRHEDHYGIHDEDDDDEMKEHLKIKHLGHHRFGMRRNRMGRFV